MEKTASKIFYRIEEKEDEIPDMIVDENGKIKIDLNEEVDGEAIDMIPI